MRRRFTTSVVLTAVCTMVVVGSASASSARTVLPGSKPSWAVSARQTATVPASAPVDFTVYLNMRDPGGAEALARAVSTPGSGKYGNFLSNSAFTASFAPTVATTNTLTAWLRSQGLKVTGVASNRTWVSASGSATAVGKAFGTSFALFKVNGHSRRAVTSAVTVPSTIASAVTYVGGLSLDSGKRPAAPPSDGFRVAPPCSAYWGQKIATGVPSAYGSKRPWAVCGYTPKQLRGAYGLTAVAARHGLLGQGQSVAFTDTYDSPTIVHDVNTFSRRHGLPTLKPGQYLNLSDPGLSDKPNSPDCGDWYGEQTLDFEAIHAMAPAARIVYDGTPDCSDAGSIASLHKIIDKHRAQIISNSWGDLSKDFPSGLRKAFHQVLVQAALKGIGVYFSSGDDGDNGDATGTVQVDWPADDNFATGVGGTSLAVGRSNQYLWETDWGNYRSVLTAHAWDPALPGEFWDGGGGGISRDVKQPWYQRGVVPYSLSHAFGSAGFPNGNRVVPDVSAVGNPATGMLVGQTQTWLDGSVHYGEYRIGGTSVSSPLFAGMMAIADQAAGHPHGFVNPALYSLAGSRAFHDILSPRHKVVAIRRDYNNGQTTADGVTISTRTFNMDSSLKATRGYDDATGVGSPNGSWFFQLMARLK